MNEKRFTPAVAASGGIPWRGARMAGTESAEVALCANVGASGIISATRTRARMPNFRTSRHPAARLTPPILHGGTPAPHRPVVVGMRLDFELQPDGIEHAEQWRGLEDRAQVHDLIVAERGRDAHDAGEWLATIAQVLAHVDVDDLAVGGSDHHAGSPRVMRRI